MANLNQLALVAHLAGIDLPGWFVSVVAIARQLTIVDDLAELPGGAVHARSGAPLHRGRW